MQALVLKARVADRIPTPAEFNRAPGSGDPADSLGGISDTRSCQRHPGLPSLTIHGPGLPYQPRDSLPSKRFIRDLPQLRG